MSLHDRRVSPISLDSSLHCILHVLFGVLKLRYCREQNKTAIGGFSGNTSDEHEP